MANKIIDKINEISALISSDTNGPGRARANELSKQAAAAIRNGINSRDWETYMKNFTDPNNPAQLKRLIGEDADFNDTEWGLDSLAYLVANSTCDVNTTTKTVNTMSTDMINNFDEGITEA